MSAPQLARRRLAFGPRRRTRCRNDLPRHTGGDLTASLRAFAEEHLATERQHLQIMASLTNRGARDYSGPGAQLAG